MRKPGMDLTGLDLTQPNSARVHDYILGGAHNFEVDRRTGDEILLENPWLAEALREDRHFLRRAVRHLCAGGVRQFIDIGSGLPTTGNVHEIAQQTAEDAVVVYVDIDPLVVAHSLELLADNPRATAILGDVRESRRILADPTVNALLDFEQPIGVILGGVLHFIPGDVERALEPLRNAMAPGSHLVITHAGTTNAVRFGALLRSSRPSITVRDSDEILAMIQGLTLVEPGVVPVPLWCPEQPGRTLESAPPALSIACVARRD
ncbi:SAM-dependent methyltransferase [Actinoalloteichus hymeniacidonis]|uniref:S-adenosyl methyltransferase n=1 Tax=Actinoalloteichus hymeniacidonis TaxID=340345 RepID=A0AAC9HN49_9PSEU|nr:SAM-dependent methyltransferase [Actinoalloteichus hymeniacidonis]AOS61791.1 S-adenosyl methyltransferase [Actinoalloteichus hymeniacidonis]